MKVWKPKLRDTRSHREVVEKKIVVVDVPTNVGLERGLEKALVYYFKDGVSMKKPVREVEDKGIEDLAFSKFDLASCLKSKVNRFRVLNIKDKELESIKTFFIKVIPWNKQIRQVINRRFEIVGLPIHIWNDLTIHKIGSCLDEVTKIHDQKHNFNNVELSLNLNHERVL